MVAKRMLELLLEKTWPYITVDTAAKDLVIPDNLRKNPKVVLQIGYNMANPLPDLTIDDFGISVTLSFGGSYQLCKIPWHACLAFENRNENEEMAVIFRSPATIDRSIKKIADDLISGKTQEKAKEVGARILSPNFGKNKMRNKFQVIKGDKD
jgi:hypothetical protein